MKNSKKAPLYYIQEIGYSNEGVLLRVIHEYEEDGFVVAVDFSNKKRIYSPQTKSGMWTAVLIKVRETRDESWDEYKKRKDLLFLGVRDIKEKQKWKEEKLRKKICCKTPSFWLELNKEKDKKW